MKKGLIIVNQELGHNEYKIQRFFEECQKLNLSLGIIVNDGTLLEINENGSARLNIPKLDFVIYLDKDYYLAKALEKSGYRLFNNAEFIKLCDDKSLTYVSCLNHGIKMLHTIPAPLFYGGKLKEENFKFLDKVETTFSYPLIMKRVYSSLGEGVYKINNKNQLRELYAKYAKEAILFQKYLNSSEGRSVRVLIINGKVFGQYLRLNGHDFRSNYGTDQRGEEYFNQEFGDFAQDIANKLDIEYAGIDLLFDENNKPVLCEINSNAFFEIFERVTGKNVAKAFLEMIKEKI